MNKKLNIKFLAILLAALAVLAVGVHFIHAYQVQRNAGAFLALADEALADGKKLKAAEYLARYLALQPADTDTRARFALLLADEKVATSPKALMRAYLVLGQVLLRDPSRHEVRRRVVEIAMDGRLQRFRDAVDHLAKLQEDFPDDKSLPGLRARCYQGNGEYKEARVAYEEAIARDPFEIENYVRLAFLLRDRPGQVKSKGETDEKLEHFADAHVISMAKANPQNFKVYLVQAHYRRRFAKPSESYEQVQADIESFILKAQSLAPANVDVILELADLHREKKQPQAARKLLHSAIAAPGNAKDWRLVQALSRLEFLDRQPKAALACLRDGLKEMPDQFDLLWNFAHLLIHQRQDDEFIRVKARLENAGLPSQHLQYLQARMDVNQAQWLKAARALERVYPQFITGDDHRKDWFTFNLGLECNQLLGICYEQMGDPDRAASAYNRVVAREPRSVAGRLGLARMKWSLGQLDGAELEYRKLLTQVVARDLPPTVWVEVSQLLIERNLRTERSDWTQLEQLLKQVEKLPKELRPEEAMLALLGAEVLVAHKDYDEARRRLENVKDGNNARPAEIWIGLANLEMRRGKNDTALQMLDEAAKQLGDRVELHLARARYWARRGGPGAVKDLTKLAQNMDGFSSEDRQRLLRGLAEANGQIGELNESTRLWRQVAAQRPTDISSRLTLFDLALLSNDGEAMPNLAAEIAALEGAEGSLSLYCTASYRIWQAQRGNRAGLTEAAQLLKTVADRRPGLARVPLAQAIVDDLQGQSDAAVANYKLAVLLGEQRPAVIRQLVQLLTARGHHLAAEEIIRKLRAQAPILLIGLERETAVIALFGRDTVHALELARKAVPVDSKDYRDHVWLGRLLWAAGESADAEASLRRALVLNDQVPETWVALVQHLVRTDDKAKAETVVKQAEATLPKGKYLLDLAQCYYMVGKANRATELYEAAFSARPEDATVLYEMALLCWRSNKVEEAKAHLKHITRLKTTTASQAAKAKRTLALVTALGGDFQKSQDALKLLDGSGDALPAAEAVADQRARLVILARQPSVRKRREAIAILQELMRKQLATAQERFLLAHLYESVGEWPASRSQMTALLSIMEERMTQATNPADKKSLEGTYGQFVAYFCVHLLQRNETGDAKVWQTKLQQLEPDTFRSLEVRVRLMSKQGKSAETVPLLQKLAQKDEAYVQPVASLLEQVGQIDAAQVMYEQFAARAQPEAVLELAAFHGRQQRTAEALAICEKAWKTCAPDTVSGVSVAVLHGAKTADDSVAQVAKRIEAAIAKHADKATLLMNDLAAVRRLQGRNADAVEILRQISAQDKSDALALNNLAWLLALSDKADESLALVETAITLRGELPELLDTRAIAYLRSGKHRLAVADLEEAIAAEPTASRYFHLAQAELSSNNQVAALDALANAKKLGLTEAIIDPLERTAYRELLAKLDRP